MLDEGLGLELSNFGRLMKMRPGVGDEHQLEQRLGNTSCFRQLDYARKERGNLVRRNALSTEEDLKALIKRERAGRRDDFAAYAGDKHDVPRPVQGGCVGNEGRNRKIRFDRRGNGHGVVTCIHQQLLSSGLEDSNNQLRERYQQVIDRYFAGTVRGLRHESFVKGHVVLSLRDWLVSDWMVCSHKL